VRAAAVFFLAFLTTAPVFSQQPIKTYTDKNFFYSIDYPETWKLTSIAKAVVIRSPRQSDADDFSENVHIVAEDLEDAGTHVELIDYYRQGMGSASRTQSDFKVLEEARTVWLDRDTIVSLYTMTNKGRTFKCKVYTFMAGKMVYVLTYTAADADFETHLSTSEAIMRSIQVSP
jgi:hypothetical protein